MTISKYRSRGAANQLIGFSVSFERRHLLARGLGLEHLREMILRLARPLLRQGSSLAYGGHWREAEDNFTFELLRLISAEQEDNSLGGPDSDRAIGRLVNHLAWPHYLDVTPRIEAQWIHCCRIVRISQVQAGIASDQVIPDDRIAEPELADHVAFNSAITLSAMRRLAALGMSLTIPDVPTHDVIPAVSARIVLGGRVQGYSGFLPGIFEEALRALQGSQPLYVLGGFGGAAEILAEAMLGSALRDELSVAWHEQATPRVATLRTLSEQRLVPPDVFTTRAGLEALAMRIEEARAGLSSALRTGLSDAETRELMTTRDMRRAVQLTLEGLRQARGFTSLPS